MDRYKLNTTGPEIEERLNRAAGAAQESDQWCTLEVETHGHCSIIGLPEGGKVRRNAKISLLVYADEGCAFYRLVCCGCLYKHLEAHLPMNVVTEHLPPSVNDDYFVQQALIEVLMVGDITLELTDHTMAEHRQMYVESLNREEWIEAAQEDAAALNGIEISIPTIWAESVSQAATAGNYDEIISFIDLFCFRQNKMRVGHFKADKWGGLDALTAPGTYPVTINTRYDPENWLDPITAELQVKF